MIPSFLFTAITFLSAFLMFQIELIISKIFLPGFGGSYLVWGAALVFFQCTLLAGYWFSQRMLTLFGIGRYRPYHMLLLALPLAVFPGTGLPAIAPRQGVGLVFDVFLQMAISIGPVFFALSTSAVVFQSWLAASKLPSRNNPWVLYAFSNLGSFLALVSYPFLVEPFLGLSTQVLVWRMGYLVLVALCLAVFACVRTEGPLAAPLVRKSSAVPADRLSWFLFSAAGVMSFMSVTNIITYEMTPAPLLWIIPLCIYLLSFVLNFKRVPYCPAWIYEKFHLIAGWAILAFFLTLQRTLPITVLLLMHTVILFCLCMFCQRELMVRKPGDTSALPTFYLVLSLGGFVGGVVVTWIMPLVTSSMLEYPLALLLILVALGRGDMGEPMGVRNIRLIVYAHMALIIWPIVTHRYNVFALVLLFWMFYAICTQLKKSPKSMLMLCALVVVILPFIEPLWTKSSLVFTRRNYYGIYYVYDNRGVRFLNNGTTMHGGQYLDSAKALEPVTYYHKDGPLGRLLTSSVFDFKRVGIVGLGVGGIAAYGRQGQSIDYYEIDPEVQSIASTFFSYLYKTPARVSVSLGDARINLAKAQGKEYDLIIIDAFSGDSIPMHLITAEAIQTYRSRLSPGGVILVHISNRYLDLVPVLYSNAAYLGGYAVLNKSDVSSVSPPICASHWVTLTWDPGALKALVEDLGWKREYQHPVKRIRPWTDDFANILAVLRVQALLNSIRFFQPFRW